MNVDHRRGTVAPGDLILHPCRVGSHAGLQHLHRGCAPAERPRSGRHPRVEWDLTRGLRRRVAEDQLATVEGDLINRSERFDEADIDAALARFDELSRPPAIRKRGDPRPGRLLAVHSTAATGTRWLDWPPTDSIRRPPKGPAHQGIRHGMSGDRDFRAPHELAVRDGPVAIRGSRLGLTRGRFRDTATPTGRSQSSSSR